MTRTLVVAAAIAIAGCGTRSDFAYADRTAAIDLGAADRIEPATGGNAVYDAMWITAPNDVWVGGKNDGYVPVMQRELDGVSTGFYFDPAFGFGATTRMWGASGDAMWATAGKTILRWDGVTWADAVDASSDIVDLNGASIDDVWAVGRGIVLHRGGHGWDAMRPVSATTSWTGVAADGSGGAWIVAPDLVAHGDPDGFRSAPASVTLNAPAIAAIGTIEAWVVGNDAGGRAVVARVADEGARWTPVDAPIPTFSRLSRVWAVGRDDVWIVGDALLHWNGDALHEALCDDGSGAGHVAGRDVSATTTDVWVLGRCGAGQEGVLHWRR